MNRDLFEIEVRRMRGEMNEMEAGLARMKDRIAVLEAWIQAPTVSAAPRPEQQQSSGSKARLGSSWLT